MNYARTLAVAAGSAALLAATAGCSNDGAQDSPTATAPSATAGAPPTGTSTPQQHSGTAQPTKTVTVQPTRPVPTTIPKPAKPTGPGSEYDVPCTGGPGEGTICTNPNHGAGDDPYGTGTVAPTPSKPR